MYSCEAVLKSFAIAFWKRSSFSLIIRYNADANHASGLHLITRHSNVGDAL